VTDLIDFGPQPVCSHYLTDPSSEEPLFPLAVKQCRACGLVQIENTVAADQLAPPYDWIRYNEPEGHLDRTVAEIAGIIAPLKGKHVTGLSSKDASTLQRLHKLGALTYLLDPQKDLACPPGRSGVESVQAAVSPAGIRDTVEQRGRADLVVARHILEHAHDLKAFAAGVRELAESTGHVLFEVPDSTAALEHGDYTCIWEDHVVYFTPQTFRTAIGMLGLELERILEYPYPLENSLVAVASVQGRPGTAEAAGDLKGELERARRFAEGFAARRSAVRGFLEKQRRKGRLAVFGAGHRAAKFINFFDVADLLEFVVDDHPQKAGLYMPGSHLPIVPSSRLLEDDIAICLLSLNPESEKRVMEKFSAYRRRGGEFLSIFPGTPHAIPVEET